MKDHIFFSDLYRYEGLRGYKGLLKALLIPGFKYTLCMRLFQNASFRMTKLLYKCILRRYSTKYGIQISAKTKIGKGFYIGHFGNIVVNHRSVIGENCNIAQGVTIGQTNRGSRKGTPVIGDSVWIGTNSVIVGNVRIGDNVLIAPLSYVNIDVPSNSIVIGNPAEVITGRLGATESYINYKCDDLDL